MRALTSQAGSSRRPEAGWRTTDGRGQRTEGREQKAEGGFTLLELIVVLVILGMASSITMLEVGKRRDKMLFMDEARKIAITLKAARQKAVMERVEYSFTSGMDIGGIPYYALSREGQPTGAAASLPEGFEMTPTVVAFYPRGYSSGAAISLKDARGHSASIKIDPVLGKVTIDR